MTSSNHHRGDTILVPFPLSDPNAVRRRPAVVVSTDLYNANTGEVIVAQLTTRSRANPRMGDHVVVDWENAGLLGPTTARSRLVTVSTGRVLRKLGTLSRRDMDALAQWLRRVLEL